MKRNLKDKTLHVNSAGAVIFTIKKGKIFYLLLKNFLVTPYWGFPKGETKKGETILETIARELKEEAGISEFEIIKGFKEYDQYVFVNKRGIRVSKKVTYLLAYIPDKKIIISNEHQGYSWGDINQALTKLNKKIFKDILKHANRKIIETYAPKTKSNGLQEVSFVSFPKAGRTWITILISRILQRKYGFKESYVVRLERMSSVVRSLPPITIVHEDNPHEKEGASLSKYKIGCYGKKIILLVRNPQDIIVSFYFHQSKRKVEKNYKKSISKFLFEKKGGFDVVIRYYNLWEKNKSVPKGFLLVKYEDFKAHPEKHTRRILKFIGVKNVSRTEIKEAVKYASFENMRKMEEENKFKVKSLRPGDIKDLESFKVRRGKIGGYQDYLTKRDISKLNKKMKNLSGFYGYKV